MEGVAMDRAISASEANQHFSEMLREVQQGEAFVVMSRGRAVARVVPVETKSDAAALHGLLTYLDRLPSRHVDPWTRDDLYA
jgi:prevent-host-death family protein